MDADDLNKLFDTEPVDYKIAWNELKNRTIKLKEYAPPSVPSVNFSQYLYIAGGIGLTLIACAVDAVSS